MDMRNHRMAQLLGLLLLALTSSGAWSQTTEPWRFLLPEQRATQVRAPSQLTQVPIPPIPRPPTISHPQFDAPPRLMSLSDAINMGLANLDAVRVLGGINAVSTGRTVYDVAIANTGIDQARATFDPNLLSTHAWNRTESPTAFLDPLVPGDSIISGVRGDGISHLTGLSKRTLTGGVIDFGVNSNDNRLRPGTFPLNPQTRSAAELSLTQPLLQGGGARVNTIPIVLARIETERSYFQFKNSVQSHVLSVIEGYWALVSARTDLWAREQQVRQLEFANRRTQARLEVGDTSAGEAAQTQVAYENFRATLVAAQANVLNREAALRNVLGLPPFEAQRLIPSSPLVDERLPIDWERLLELASVQRPEIIELKLILEADLERLLLSRNQASPRLDGVALYRWNGLEGTMPNGTPNASEPGQFADWNLGINFSVPLGLRRERALLRQQELLIRRDRVNLEQGLHQASHDLALNLRNLEQFFEQYQRYRAVRRAARLNLEQQMESYNEQLIQFIIVLQAIVDWGNAVSNEALALVQYNSELARLERETGTILESHGIAFFEERFGSIGPLGRCAEDVCYPAATHPSATVDRYPGGDVPSEQFFELSDPAARKDKRSERDVPLEEIDAADAAAESEDTNLLERVLERLEETEESLPELPERTKQKPDSSSNARPAPVRAADRLRGLLFK